MRGQTAPASGTTRAWLRRSRNVLLRASSWPRSSCGVAIARFGCVRIASVFAQHPQTGRGLTRFTNTRGCEGLPERRSFGLLHAACHLFLRRRPGSSAGPLVRHQRLRSRDRHAPRSLHLLRGRRRELCPPTQQVPTDHVRAPSTLRPTTGGIVAASGPRSRLITAVSFTVRARRWQVPVGTTSVCLGAQTRTRGRALRCRPLE